MAYIFPLNSNKTAWNSSIVQTWNVIESETASGKRRAVCSQLNPRYTFNVEFPVLKDNEVDTLLGFYSLRKGSLVPFFYKDTDNYHVDKQVLSADSNGKYQCVIKQGGYVEACYYVDNLHVYVNDVETTDYTESNGVITINADSGAVTASYDYYWKVKFDNSITITKIFKNVNRVNLKLTTVR